MAESIPDRLAGVHPKMIAAELATDRNPLAAGVDTDRKRVAELEARRRVGRLIERALTHARLTQQEMSHAMGYQDQSALSRWIAGVERPLLDKLFAVDGFYDGWVIACAEASPRIEVTTVVTIRKVA